MAIRKQEFYEGAAIHALVCAGSLTDIRYVAPFFALNNRLLAYIKYSTKGRSPWSFTFTTNEQQLLRESSESIVIALVCGSDGVAAMTVEEFRSTASTRDVALHLGCHRRHGKHYEVGGPDGILPRKISPSRWRRILETQEKR
jgi:hypothetical protein